MLAALEEDFVADGGSVVLDQGVDRVEVLREGGFRVHLDGDEAVDATAVPLKFGMRLIRKP